LKPENIFVNKNKNFENWWFLVCNWVQGKSKG
jgi:hypothetical protein